MVSGKGCGAGGDLQYSWRGEGDTSKEHVQLVCQTASLESMTGAQVVLNMDQNEGKIFIWK